MSMQESSPKGSMDRSVGGGGKRAGRTGEQGEQREQGKEGMEQETILVASTDALFRQQHHPAHLLRASSVCRHEYRPAISRPRRPIYGPCTLYTYSQRGEVYAGGHKAVRDYRGDCGSMIHDTARHVCAHI